MMYVFVINKFFKFEQWIFFFQVESLVWKIGSVIVF